MAVWVNSREGGRGQLIQLHPICSNTRVELVTRLSPELKLLVSGLIYGNLQVYMDPHTRWLIPKIITHDNNLILLHVLVFNIH